MALVNHYYYAPTDGALCGEGWAAPPADWAGVSCPDCLSKVDGIDLESPASSEVAPSATESLKGPQNRVVNEGTDLMVRFMVELQRATGDGSRKRKAGTKPPWYADDSHEGAIFSHITKWKRHELVDPDSGAHPLVHAAWRCLAIACRETGNVPDST